jgi:hypothetical protein
LVPSGLLDSIRHLFSITWKQLSPLKMVPLRKPEMPIWYPAAVAELKRDGTIRRRCQLRPCKYLNNVAAQVHRNVKCRTWLAKGYGWVRTAWRTLRGIEAMGMIRKGRAVAQVKFISKLFGIAA